MKMPVKRILNNCFYALNILFQTAPGYVVYTICFTVFTEVCILIEHTFVIAYIVDCIENRRPLFDVLIVFISLTAAIIVRFLVGPYVSAYIKPEAVERINKKIRFLIYEKSINMDVECYDDPEFYNDFVLIINESPKQILGVLKSTATLISLIIVTLMVSVYIIQVDYVGILFVFGAVTINFICRLLLHKVQIEFIEQEVPLQRKEAYYNRTFYLPEYAKEMRVSEISEVILRDYKETVNRMIGLTRRYGGKIAIIEYVMAIVGKSIAFDGLYLSYLLYQVFIPKIFGYGILVALYNAVNNFKSNLEKFVNIIPEFQRHGLYIEKLRGFIEYENKLKDEGSLAVPPKGDLDIKNAWFFYKGNNLTTAILKGVDINISQGKKIAIVGNNGAGKTTLIKLLIRFYDPEIGKIIYAGNKYDKYPLAEYRKLFGAVFQNCEIFATNLEQNITMSLDRVDERKAEDIFKLINFGDMFDNNPDKFKRVMTKEFCDDGVNLSGGEKQKLAIVRTVYSDASILILDEASSALDPIAEAQLNQMILGISTEKTVIIITHRLSTVRYVDEIYMIEDGKIVENGTHDDLLKKNGKYAEVYMAQALNYNSISIEEGKSV